MSDHYPLSKALDTEYRHFSSFYIVGLIAGILTALKIPVLPVWLPLGLIFTGIAGIRIRKYSGIHHLGYLCLFFGLGISAMNYRITQIPSQKFFKPLYDLEISGQIDSATIALGKQQIILKDIHFLNRIGEPVPTRIKLTYPYATPSLSRGMMVTVRGFIRPPMPPLFPNGYHEKQSLFFQGIGAVGRIDEVLGLKPAPDTFLNNLYHLRQNIAHHIRSAMPDEAARIAIPLTIGDQSVVTPDLYRIFRSAGITHILSVSGFHLSLLAILAFFVIRKLLALFPAISERFNTKKPAALIALLLTTGYILISGMQIPAIRSWIMMMIVLIALGFNRSAFSVRSLMIAAFVILIYRPDMVLNVGFQLSFMAVMVLVCLYQPLRRWIFPQKPSSFIGYLLRTIIGFMLIDIVITIMLSPLTIYHFNQYALYSGLGNLLTGLILSFVIMPLLFLSLILMPFGWDTFFLKGAAIGLEYLIAVCDKIDHFPHALIYLSSFPTSALLVMISGIIMLCFMKTYIRWIGIGVIGIGIGIAVFSPRPDILIGDRGQTIAVRQENGRLTFLRQGPSTYTTNYWLIHNGEEPYTIPNRNDFPCRLRLKDHTIAFCDEACFGADICFSENPHTRGKDTYYLHDSSTRAIYVGDNQIDVIMLD